MALSKHTPREFDIVDVYINSLRLKEIWLKTKLK
jgi:hypothetical protein